MEKKYSVSDVRELVKYHLPHKYHFGVWSRMTDAGIEDKNGMEIYEGDVVKNGPVNQTVEWGYIPDNDNGCYGYVGYLTTLEVIGNVFETPELLTQSEARTAQ